MDLPQNVTSNTLQYADDTTLYKHRKVSNLKTCAQTLQQDQNLSDWSNEQNLLFNNSKTKLMLCSSSAMSRTHSLDQTIESNVCHNNTSKILGLHFDEHLTWKEHVTKTTQSSYLLSKLNFNNVVYGQLPKYLVNRLQRVQNVAASYVTGRYVSLNDIIDLGWLPVKENFDFATVKLAHNAMHDKNWRSYLPL
ncbi:uncharacterized protein LOC130636943 [Hydractinia symbiolongicarpus]|uniref:uncharacterized protein LOC130636943 n=1 Tax=Hydractinia symbiolongicarpus TaxID=13093 RepID=UPI00254EE62C|nr:uncharacterized protein LOC130636943 [Hydractinia symbiolongicarpus]